MKNILSKLILIVLVLASVIAVPQSALAVDKADKPKKVINMVNADEDKGMLVKEWADDDPELYVRPSVPSGKLFSVVAQVDYSSYRAVDWMHVERTENTCAAEYGFTTRNNNDKALYIVTVGGNSLPGISYWTGAKNIQNSTGVMAFVDFRNIRDGASPEFGLALCVSDDGTKSVMDDLTLVPPTDGKTCYYYDYDGDWQQSVTADGRAMLPDNFVGYVYFPANAFDGLTENGKMLAKYLQHVKVYYKIHDENECATTILTDDLVFVSESDQDDEHNYVAVKTVSATCRKEGYTLMRCASCGQTKRTDVTPKAEHDYGEAFALGDGSGKICRNCKRLERSDEGCQNKVETATVTFSYGQPVNKEIELTFPVGYTLAQDDVPWIYRGENTNQYGITDLYQFFAFNTSTRYDQTLNPVGYTVSKDITFYGTYNRYSYDNEHFGHMFKQVATHGGPYCTENMQNKTLFIGNSNYMLWWGMESWYDQRGVEVINSSVAGGTCYDFLEFVEELVFIYHPKIVVMGVSSNDYCYHQMKDSDIIKHETEFMDKIREILPDVKFVVTGMNPLPGRPEYFNAIKRINAKFSKLCDEMPDATFIDTSTKVWEYCKEFPEGWSMWTHMEEDKLSYILGDMLLPTIQHLLAE